MVPQEEGLSRRTQVYQKPGLEIGTRMLSRHVTSHWLPKSSLEEQYRDKDWNSRVDYLKQQGQIWRIYAQETSCTMTTCVSEREPALIEVYFPSLEGRQYIELVLGWGVHFLAYF